MKTNNLNSDKYTNPKIDDSFPQLIKNAKSNKHPVDNKLVDSSSFYIAGNDQSAADFMMYN